MKKTICLAIALIFVAALFAGCNVAHIHQYSKQWSISATEHWHQAACEHSDLVRDKAEHTFVDGKCSVCGYVQGTHVHTFSELWSQSATEHWHQATCDHSELVSNRGTHRFDGNRCVVCGYVISEPEPSPEPTPTEYEFGDAQSYQNDAFYKDYPAEEKELYYTLWKETTTVKVEIDISAHELQKLNEAYVYYKNHNGSTLLADVYRKCNLTIYVNGRSYYYEEVGIRMRGNTSRAEFVNNNGEIYNLVHFRFNLSETFDGEDYEGDAWANELYHDWGDTDEGKAARKLRKDRTFATMEKFFYKWNKNYDQTYIREIYTNRMFQAYGILAPHITLSQFCVKQGGAMQSIGVGGLYELIDKQFIKRNFDKAHKGGDLYKCTYSAKGPADFTNVNSRTCGIESATEPFSYDLKTNDDPTEPEWSNHSYLYEFADMLAADKNSPNFKTNLESMVDMDYFARFEAVNYLAGNPDCIRNHANNFYIYFTPKDDNGNFKAYLIPYDYDRCLGITRDWNPWNGMTENSPYTTRGTDMNCVNPLYTKTILDGGIDAYRNKYTAALKNVLDGEWFTTANFTAMYNAYSANYSSLARPSFDIANVSMDQFRFSLDGSQNVGDTRQNIALNLYMQLKRQTALNGLDK